MIIIQYRLFTLSSSVLLKDMNMKPSPLPLLSTLYSGTVISEYRQLTAPFPDGSGSGFLFISEGDETQHTIIISLQSAQYHFDANAAFLRKFSPDFELFNSYILLHSFSLHREFEF